MNMNGNIIESFCSIPNVLKTVLLIEKDAIRYRVLEMPIFQRSLIQTELIGEWLVLVLLSQIYYCIEIISDIKMNQGLNQEEFNSMKTS